MSTKGKVVACLLVSSIAVLFSTRAQLQTFVSAKIISSDGRVEIQRRSQANTPLVKINYSVNDELLAGDVVKTYRGGRLVLGLSDGSQAIISENTTVEITNPSQTPRTIFNLLRGRTRIKIEKVGGKPNPYRVNTPTAVIAVRGTLFDVFASTKETQVFVLEGEVAVSNLFGPEMIVILTPGQRTRVLEAQPPEAPSTFRSDRNNDTFNQPPPDRAGNGQPPGDNGPNGPGSTNPGQGPGQGPPSQQPNNPGNGPGGPDGGGRHP